MEYQIQYKPRALRDLEALAPAVNVRVMKKLDALRHDLAGNVKRLVSYTPGWRLRVGDWRVLFEISGSTIVVWRVVHRSEAYE
jgi:mRNA interferase RelE/StbE